VTTLSKEQAERVAATLRARQATKAEGRGPDPPLIALTIEQQSLCQLGFGMKNAYRASSVPLAIIVPSGDWHGSCFAFFLLIGRKIVIKRVFLLFCRKIVIKSKKAGIVVAMPVWHGLCLVSSYYTKWG